MAYQIRNDLCLNVVKNAQSQSVILDMCSTDYISLQAVYSDATTGAKTFVYLSGNSVTMTAHGQSTGSVGQLTTTVALPTGLSAATNYYLIIVDANTVQFATSLANAVAGTAVVLSGAGSGTQTFTPTALSGVLKVSVSNDAVSPTNWTDIPNTTVTITAAGTTFWSSTTSWLAANLTTVQLNPRARWQRVLYTPTSGQVTLTVAVCSTRDNLV